MADYMIDGVASLMKKATRKEKKALTELIKMRYIEVMLKHSTTSMTAFKVCLQLAKKM